jgi:hypothetical protein
MSEDGCDEVRSPRKALSSEFRTLNSEFGPPSAKETADRTAARGPWRLLPSAAGGNRRGEEENDDPQVTGAIEEEREETSSRQHCRELFYEGGGALLEQPGSLQLFVGEVGDSCQLDRSEDRLQGSET